MGISFAYVPTLTAIGSTYGIASIFGAQLVGGIAAIIVGAFIKPLRKLFPSLVAGTVVFTIGLIIISYSYQIRGRRIYIRKFWTVYEVL